MTPSTRCTATAASTSRGWGLWRTSRPRRPSTATVGSIPRVKCRYSRWVCVEWHFAVANNEMGFWLDGNELSDLRVVDRGSGPESGCLGDDLKGQWLAPPAFQSL